MSLTLKGWTLYNTCIQIQSEKNYFQLIICALLVSMWIMLLLYRESLIHGIQHKKTWRWRRHAHNLKSLFTATFPSLNSMMQLSKPTFLNPGLPSPYSPIFFGILNNFLCWNVHEFVGISLQQQFLSFHSLTSFIPFYFSS